MTKYKVNIIIANGCDNSPTIHELNKLISEYLFEKGIDVHDMFIGVELDG